MHPSAPKPLLEQQLGQHGGLRVGGLGLPGLFGALEQGQLLAQRVGTAHIATPYLEVGRASVKWAQAKSAVLSGCSALSLAITLSMRARVMSAMVR